MRFRSNGFRRLLAVPAAALMLGALAAAPAGAQTAPRTITVSKATGLVAGETVTVSWTGAGNIIQQPIVYIQACKRGQVQDVSIDCAILSLITPDNTPSGAGSADYIVRSNDPDGSDFDEGFVCDATHPCDLTMRNSFDNSDNSLVKTPIEFAPAGPEPVVPEAGLPVILPLGALAMFGGAYLVLRRRGSVRTAA